MRQRKNRAPGKLASKAGRKLLTGIEYHLLTALQRPFGSVFWRMEQRRGRLMDWLENERGEQ